MSSINEEDAKTLKEVSDNLRIMADLFSRIADGETGLLDDCRTQDPAEIANILSIRKEFFEFVMAISWDYSGVKQGDMIRYYLDLETSGMFLIRDILGIQKKYLFDPYVFNDEKIWEFTERHLDSTEMYVVSRYYGYGRVKPMSMKAIELAAKADNVSLDTTVANITAHSASAILSRAKRHLRKYIVRESDYLMEAIFGVGVKQFTENVISISDFLESVAPKK